MCYPVAEIKTSKIINCPDYGDIEISIFLPEEVLFSYLENEKVTTEDFLSLLNAITKSTSIGIRTFSEDDLEVIAHEIAKNYRVERQYQVLRETSSREEAIRMALSESAQANLDRAFSEALQKQGIESAEIVGGIISSANILNSSDIWGKVFKQNRALEDTLKAVADSKTGFEKLLSAIHHQSQLPDGFLELNRIGMFLNSFEKQRFDFLKAFDAALAPFDKFRDFAQEISRRTSDLSEAIKCSIGFAESLRQLSLQPISLKGNCDSVLARLMLSSEAVLSSDMLVVKANDYFSTWWEWPPLIRMPQIPKRIEGKASELDIGVSKSEIIVEEEAGRSIILTNKLAEAIIETRNELRELAQYKPLLKRISLLQNPKTFLECLSVFSSEMGKNYHRVLWNKDGTGFIASPERTVQSHLGIFLKGRFGGVAFVGKEISAGSGYVDLYVHYMGTEYVIEIKVVGDGWSIENAESGLGQLDAYMHTLGRNESYLVVMDGRKTGRGKNLKDEYHLDHGIVHVIVGRVYWQRPSS